MIQLREEHWVVADLTGKAEHIGTVPIATWVKAAIDEWEESSGIRDGAVFRSINKADRVWGDGMTLRCCGRLFGRLQLAPVSRSLLNLAFHKIDAEIHFLFG